MLACAGVCVRARVGARVMSKGRRRGGWRTAAPSGRRWRRTHSFTDLTRKVRALLKGTSAAAPKRALEGGAAALPARHCSAPTERRRRLSAARRVPAGCDQIRGGGQEGDCGSKRYRPEHARAHTLQLCFKLYRPASARARVTTRDGTASSPSSRPCRQGCAGVHCFAGLADAAPRRSGPAHAARSSPPGSEFGGRPQAPRGAKRPGRPDAVRALVTPTIIRVRCALMIRF